MADDASLLDVGSDHEARHISEKQQRDLERIAQPDESRRFVGRIVEQHAALLHRLVGHDPQGVPVEPGEAGEELLGEQLLELQPRALVDDRLYHLAHVVTAARLLGDQLAQRFLAAARWLRRPRHDSLVARLRHVPEVGLGELDRFFVVGHERIAKTTFGRVHPCPAKLLERDLLADHDLDHARRAEIHRRVAFDHYDHVAEGRYVRAAGR